MKIYFPFLRSFTEYVLWVKQRIAENYNNNIVPLWKLFGKSKMNIDYTQIQVPNAVVWVGVLQRLITEGVNRPMALRVESWTCRRWAQLKEVLSLGASLAVFNGTLTTCFSFLPSCNEMSSIPCMLLPWHDAYHPLK